MTKKSVHRKKKQKKKDAKLRRIYDEISHVDYHLKHGVHKHREGKKSMLERKKRLIEKINS